MSAPSSAHALRAALMGSSVRFPARPRLAPDLDTFALPDGLGVQVRGAGPPVLFRGRHAEGALRFLLGKLDGTRTVDDLLAEAPAEIPPSTLLRTLSLLHTKGLLLDEPSAGATPADPILARQLLFWGRKLGPAGSARSETEVQRRLETSSVVLVGTGLFGAATADLLLRSGLRDLAVIAWDDPEMVPGLREAPLAPREVIALPSCSVDQAAAALRPRIEGADLLVSATRNAPAALFQAMNRIALGAGTPWLRANESATDLEIGPYVWPHQSACFTCLVMRRASTHEHAVEEELHERHLARERPAGETAPRGELLVAACAGAALVALEVERILTAVAPPASLNAVVRFELLAGTLETHPLLRVPRCPDCSLVAAAAEPAP